MKKIILLLFSSIGILACSETESNLIVTGNIKDLKKGTIFLQKIEDTLLINVDSVQVNGNSEFVLKDYIESPQIMFLSLDKVDNSQYDDRLEFFADEGEVKIITSLENFEQDAKITGSQNQEKLIEFRKIMQRFDNSNLDLIKEDLEAQKNNDEESLLDINNRSDKLLKRKYLYTVNFALNNKDLELAPYLALSEVFDANIKYLDTIYSSLEPKVKESKYGKELKNFLKERRKEEKVMEKLEEEEQSLED